MNFYINGDTDTDTGLLFCSQKAKIQNGRPTAILYFIIRT